MPEPLAEPELWLCIFSQKCQPYLSEYERQEPDGKGGSSTYENMIASIQMFVDRSGCPSTNSYLLQKDGIAILVQSHHLLTSRCKTLS
jgi:hypothetical protein